MEKSKKYFLIDKWEKILYASQGKKIKNYQHNYCGDINFIKNEFSEKSFEIIQEYAPQAFCHLKNEISYLHLNTADHFSEFKTVELLYDKMTRPGYIIIDNYEYSSLPESIDGFLLGMDNAVLPLGNSQGLIIKT